MAAEVEVGSEGEKSSRATKMKWSSQHDTLLGREMLAVELWKYKVGSRERGACLDSIAEELNKIKSPTFNVSQKSVRDRIKHLEKAQKKRKSEEERASGISPEVSEINDIMEDYLERKQAADEKHEAEGEKEKAEQSKAKDMRDKAMERLAETKKRKGEDEPRKKRKKTGDTLEYLREVSERENDIRKEELDLKKRQEENATAALQMQQQQQQQQQQQFQMMMQMCLQNQQALLDLMKKGQ